MKIANGWEYDIERWKALEQWERESILRENGISPLSTEPQSNVVKIKPFPDPKPVYLDQSVPVGEAYAVWSNGGIYRNGEQVDRIGGDGYMYFNHEGSRYLSHHFVWFKTHGTWPSKPVFHVDGNRTNNRLVNLSLDKPRRVGTYRAQVRDGKRIVSLGYHATQWERDAAILTYKLSHCKEM